MKNRKNNPLGKTTHIKENGSTPKAIEVPLIGRPLLFHHPQPEKSVQVSKLQNLIEAYEAVYKKSLEKDSPYVDGYEIGVKEFINKLKELIK